MWLIVGVASAAAAALAWWQRLSNTGQAMAVTSTLRQQAGVLAAIVNMVNAVLDALLLLRRVQAVPNGTAGPTVVTPTFGRRSAEVPED